MRWSSFMLALLLTVLIVDVVHSQTCNEYDAFASSLSPQFPENGFAPTLSSTQMDSSLASTVTVTFGAKPSGNTPVRFLALAPASLASPTAVAGTGAITDLQAGAVASSFWAVNDYTGPSCTASHDVVITPLSCPSTNGDNQVTFTCTVYALLVTPNPLDSSQYLGTIATMTTTYTFAETVDTGDSTNVIGVFCGVSVTTLHCVGTRAGVDDGTLGNVITPSWASDCTFAVQGGSAFTIMCAITPDHLPTTTNFVIELITQGLTLHVGQTVAVPEPLSTSVADSAVDMTPLPSVVGNEDTLSITVTSKIGGYLEILGLTLLRPPGSPFNVPTSQYSVQRISDTSCTVIWDVLPSVLQDPTLYLGSLTLQVITRVTVGGAGRKNVELETTTRVESVNAGTVQLQETPANGMPSKQRQGLPAGAIAAIAVAACATVVAAVGFLRVRAIRRRATDVSSAVEVSSAAQPPNAPKNPFDAKVGAVELWAERPHEDGEATVVELAA